MRVVPPLPWYRILWNLPCAFILRWRVRKASNLSKWVYFPKYCGLLTDHFAVIPEFSGPHHGWTCCCGKWGGDSALLKRLTHWQDENGDTWV